jgi:predicted phosphodiesterase
MSLQKFTPKAYPKRVKEKKNMTLELLFSDVHYGKFIDNIEGNYVDNKVIRERVRKVAESVIKEIYRESKSFNVERVILALIGDVIENADFHGQESEKGCEFSTSRQVQEAINSMFYDLILPIAMTGVDVLVPCVTGNHDRIGHNKTYHKPGEDNLTYIIYSTLELLCKQSGLKNVKFEISKGLYTTVQVYGNNIVYEHGDEIKNINRDTMANAMAKRQVQLGKVIHFLRIGHWHEPVVYGQGRMIVNGSVPGQDSYADSKGFCSEAVQIMNYYVETAKRSTCFFRSFPIYLQKK